MTIWRTRISFWILNAANIRSEYVIIINFPLKTRLHESASTLQCTYVCLALFVWRWKQRAKINISIRNVYELCQLKRKVKREPLPFTHLNPMRLVCSTDHISHYDEKIMCTQLSAPPGEMVTDSLEIRTNIFCSTGHLLLCSRTATKNSVMKLSKI